MLVTQVTMFGSRHETCVAANCPYVASECNRNGVTPANSAAKKENVNNSTCKREESRQSEATVAIVVSRRVGRNKNRRLLVYLTHLSKTK